MNLNSDNPPFQGDKPKVQVKKVVVIGAGFGGLNAVRSLKKSPFDILVIDKFNHHVFQPLLYQVATAALSPGNIASPIREILSKQDNAAVIMGEVIYIEKEKKSVHLKNGDDYSFDYLILAPGASHSYFGNPGWEKFAPGLKTIHDALRIREKILLSYERAERCEVPEKIQNYMRFAIIGGGPTGVEMAGALIEIAKKSLIKNFRNIRPEQSEIFLIEGEDHLLPAFPRPLADKVLKDLEKMGVKVLLKTKVTEVANDGIFMGDKFMPCANIFWAAGNQASPLLRTLNIPLDRQGRAMVQPDLAIPGFPDIFVIGDAAHLLDKTGKSLPGIAPVAIQQGRYVAKILQKPQEKRRPFSYFDKGMMATVGKSKAVVSIGKLQISGFLAWAAWGFIHIFYLISFPNRILVMIQWIFWYLTNQRRVRLINRPVADEEIVERRQELLPEIPEQLS
jgi:NADH:ubiquinone reductase (H+-translocating)